MVCCFVYEFCCDEMNLGERGFLCGVFCVVYEKIMILWVEFDDLE